MLMFFFFSTIKVDSSLFLSFSFWYVNNKSKTSEDERYSSKWRKAKTIRDDFISLSFFLDRRREMDPIDEYEDNDDDEDDNNAGKCVERLWWGRRCDGGFLF